MKSIKIWALALMIGAGTSVFAQSDEKAPEAKKETQEGKAKGKIDQKKLTPEQIAEKQTRRMTNQLTLTEAQNLPVYDIMLERAKQRITDRETCKGEKECASASMRKRNMLADKKLKEVLTPEQYEKLKALRAAARENRGKGKGKSKAGSDAQPTKTQDNMAPDAEEKE